MQAQNNAQIEARYEQLMVGFRAVCRDYGFKDGTDKFAECVQQESNRWLQNAKQAKAEQEYRDRCFLGTTNICDKPRETTCLKDAWGNFRCQGQ